MFRIELYTQGGIRNLIELCDKEPTITNIDRHLILLENFIYKIILKSDEIFENVEMFIGDFSIPLNFNETTGYYETSSATLFEGCFDLVYINVCVTENNQKENYLYSKFIRVATTKETSYQIRNMLNEIEEKLPSFLDICFSKSNKTSGILKEKRITVWNMFKVLDEIILIYEQNFIKFIHYMKSKVIEEPEIVDTGEVKRIDEKSLRWITQNANHLISVKNNTGIRVKNKDYMPVKIKAYKNVYSYNIYENQVILGFLQYLVLYIKDKIIELDMEIKKAEDIPEEVIFKLPNTHDLTGRCIYVFYCGVIKKFKEKLESIDVLYYKYKNILQCEPIHITQVPKLTNIFKQVTHYRACYEGMAKWFETGAYTLEHLDYLFKLKTLSRLFEYFCLIKIQNAFVIDGYTLQSANRMNYDSENIDDNELINNEYIYTNGKYKLILYYEPVISRNKLMTEMNLYSTGYNFIKSHWNEYWTPDFVLQVQGNNSEYYYLIDAKFSNYINVRKRYIPELILKYSAQIASKDKHLSDIIGVGAVYPNDNNKLFYYKHNDVGSIKESLPIYFSISVEGKKEGDIVLSKRIHELLSRVDILEKGCNEEIIKNFDQKIVVKNDKVANARKCQYYNRGICLKKLKGCTVQNAFCSEYEEKNDNTLRDLDIDCRNAVIRRNKKSECAITHRSGCIGKEICKYYIKKKYNK